MQGGTLRHPLIVQQATVTQDIHGGRVEQWGSLAQVWGEITPLRGQEQLVAQQLDARLTHRIIVRAPLAVKPVDRLRYGTRIFQILSVRNLDERDRTLEILAMEVP